MFLDHATAFTKFEPVQPAPTLPRGPAFAPGTLIDTSRGWRPVEDLAPGDRVQTFDGGLVPLVRATCDEGPSVRLWHVPAGAIGNCSDFTLAEGQFIGFRGRMAQRLFGIPLVMAPATALGGFRGIRPAKGSAPTITLAFAQEDIAMAQTGTLLLVPGQTPARHYQRLDYGQTRSLLLLTDPRGCAPDLRVA